MSPALQADSLPCEPPGKLRLNIHTSCNPATPLLTIYSGDGTHFREEARTRSRIQPCVPQGNAENKPNTCPPAGEQRNVQGADAHGRAALAKRNELAGGRRLKCEVRPKPLDQPSAHRWMKPSYTRLPLCPGTLILEKLRACLAKEEGTQMLGGFSKVGASQPISAQG